MFSLKINVDFLLQADGISDLNVPQNSQEPSTSYSSSSRSPLPSIPSSKKRKEIAESDASSTSLSSFIVRTSKSTKLEIDKQIARAVYATNSSFNCMEQPEVRKAISLLRPGYVPPSRYDVSNRLLDEIYNEEKNKCFKNLSESFVCLSLDGWSNVHNEPIICATVTTENGSHYLVDTIDTSGNPHTSAYLTEVAITLINKLKTEYGCTVCSFVTDNAANMAAMRYQIRTSVPVSISRSTELNIITYGCAAHILNLLCKDLEIVNIKEHVVYIVKYFRNSHFASAAYAKQGGKKLVLPNDVRWNSLADCLEGFVESWPILFKIAEENKNEIESTIREKVSNIHLKRLAEDYLKILKPISIAIDRLQKNDASISDVVEQFKILESHFEETDFNLKQMSIFQKRYEQCVTAHHLLAFLLDPTKSQQKQTLTEKEKTLVLETVKEFYPDSDLLPLIVKYLARSEPFTDIMFDNNILKNVKPLDWWKSQQNIPIIQKEFQIFRQLFCAAASSASVERIFSTFGMVHSKVRNRLGTEKASKLVFLYKYYNN